VPLLGLPEMRVCVSEPDENTTAKVFLTLLGGIRAQFSQQARVARLCAGKPGTREMLSERAFFGQSRSHQLLQNARPRKVTALADSCRCPFSRVMKLCMASRMNCDEDRFIGTDPGTGPFPPTRLDL
jgi:hypothetical protein